MIEMINLDRIERLIHMNQIDAQTNSCHMCLAGVPL